MIKKNILLVIAVIFYLCIVGNATATPYYDTDFVLGATEHTSISTRWSTDDSVIWTYWAKQWVEYTVALSPGEWDIGLNVINHGYITPEWYSDFKIQASISLLDSTNSTNRTVDTIDTSILTVKASDTNISSDHVDVSISSAGSYNIRYTWLNDKWAPELGFDANIQIQNVFFDNQATIFNPEPTSLSLLSVDNRATIPNPEPASLLLFGTGLMGLASFLRKRRD